MSATGTSLYVHLPPHLDADEYHRRWQAGKEPDASPYGFHHAADLGWDVRFSRPRPATRRLSRRMSGTINNLTWGIDVWHAWRNRRSIREADVVWSMLEKEALAVAALMRVRIVPRKPIVTGTVWMLNDWSGFGRLQRAVIRDLTRYWSVLTTHAAPCLEIARQELPEVDSRLLHFGISEQFSPIGQSVRDDGPLVVFGMGNDRTRDWDLLLRAFGNDDRFRLDLLCAWLPEDRVEGYNNVRLVRDADSTAIRRLYADADYAAVPMRENHFSGITVALEAAALGVPILGTRTGGLRTYFEEDEMLLAEVGDADGLRAAVLAQGRSEREAMAARARRRFAHGGYTTRGMVARYDALTDEVRGKELAHAG